jgi:peptide/nickel transport system substrate-binding protein
MDNEKLRHALLVGMSQKDFMQAVVGDRPGMMRTGIGVFTPGTPLASSAGMEALSDTPDLALARRLVRESGYDGTKFPFILQTDHDRNSPLGQVGAQLLKDVGLNVDVQAMDNATAVRRRNAPQTSGAWAAYASDISGFNYSTPGTHYRLLATRPDLRIAQLVDEWFDAPDLVGQKAAAEGIQLRFFEAPPFLPLGQGFSPWAYRKGITDLIRHPNMIFWNVRKA